MRKPRDRSSFTVGAVEGAKSGKRVCKVCQRLIGLRVPRTGILQPHKVPKPTVALDIETRMPDMKVPAMVMAMQQRGASRTIETLHRRAAALGADIVHDSFTFPGTPQEQNAKMNLACGTSGLLFGKLVPGRVFGMRIQDILGAFLSAYGQHALAMQAFESTQRRDWDRLADEAIRNAPEHNRTHTAQAVKLALDEPANGGAGIAKNYEMREEAHPFQPNSSFYRAFMVPSDGPAVNVGLASPVAADLERRIVGMYVAHEIKLVKREGK